MCGPSETGKTQLIYQWLTNGTFQPKFDKIYFFYQFYQPLYDRMKKEIQDIHFVEGVNFELVQSLKNDGTKYLLIFDDSCSEVCSSDFFEKIATGGRHLGFSAIYIKHNLFHQSKKKGRDIELQLTHIALFKSPRDVQQIVPLSRQMGLSSSLVDWYRDATSVPYGHLLIDLSPPSDDRLRYCTNSGNTPSKFYLPERLKQFKTLDDAHTKSLYSPSVPILFPQLQNSISTFVSKRVYPFSQRVYSKPSTRKFAKHKKRTGYKIRKRSKKTIIKKNNVEAKKNYFGIKQRIATNKNYYSIRH